MESVDFYDKVKKPTSAMLKKALGRAYPLWEELRCAIGEQFAPLTEDWVFSGKNYGWSLRLKRKKRAVLYMWPVEIPFQACFVIGGKAAEAARQSRLPAALMKQIDEAPKYVEGRVVQIPIKSKRDVANAVKLAAVKMAN
jgi:hypothetical protein